jgi:hypothetical protein
MAGMSFIHRAIAPALALLLAASCEVALGPGRDVTLRITNVEAPAEVAAGAALTVRVTVESGGCRHFDAVVVTQSDERATIVARGHDASGPGINCPGDIRYTDREVRLEPPLLDPYTVIAKQPNGPPTTRTVRIR